MVRVNQILDAVNFLANKEQEGNTIDIPEFNIVIKMVNISFFTQRYGLPQGYQPGQPMPKMYYELTQKITDDMKGLKVRMGIEVPALMLDAKGRASIPSDYVHFSSANHNMIINNTCGDLQTQLRPIEELTDAQRGDRISDSNKMPTLKDATFTIYNTYFQFDPIGLRNVEFTYLRMPKTPFYASIPDEDTDEDVFTETGSVHFEYPEDCFNEIVDMCTGYIGLNLRSPDLMGYSENKKEKGV